MRKWETKLEISRDGEKMVSRWIQILCGLLQGDSYSPAGFCISEILVCILLQHSRGYRMGEPGNPIVKSTHSLFGRSKGVPRKPQCIKEYKQDHCTSQPRHESLLWSVKMFGSHIRTWQDGERRRSSSPAGKNEALRPR